MQVAPTTIVPMPDAAQHALAATWAMARAKHLLAREANDPAPPDVPGAREAFREAVEHLTQALDHAGGRPGHRQVEAALEEAHEALMHLTRPGVAPPIMDVVDHAWKGGELARQAVDLFGTDPIVWPIGELVGTQPIAWPMA